MVNDQQTRRPHLVVDTFEDLPALRVTPANVAERREVAAFAAEVQAVPGGSVTVAYIDHG